MAGCSDDLSWCCHSLFTHVSNPLTEAKTGREYLFTQVSQAPLSLPKAMLHAGSRAWKYSSGWKKVRTQRALMKRNTSNALKMSLI